MLQGVAAGSHGVPHWWRCDEFAMVFRAGVAIGGMLAVTDAPVVRETLVEASDILKQDVGHLMTDGPAEELSTR